MPPILTYERPTSVDRLGPIARWTSFGMAWTTPVVPGLSLVFMFPSGLTSIPPPLSWHLQRFASIAIVLAYPLLGMFLGTIGLARLGRSFWVPRAGLWACFVGFLFICNLVMHFSEFMTRGPGMR